MMFAWLALVAVGAYFTLGEGTSSSGYPDGLTLAQIQLAVTNAIEHETSVDSLTEFAQTVAPYDTSLAGRLMTRATLLKATTTKPIVTATILASSGARYYGPTKKS